jgi:hypothetical protein
VGECVSVGVWVCVWVCVWVSLGVCVCVCVRAYFDELKLVSKRNFLNMLKSTTLSLKNF